MFNVCHFKPTKVAVFTLAIVMSIAPTLASFELVLVADNTSKQINRIDGATGISLGSFGGGGFLSAARGVAAYASTGTALVLETGFVSRFNFHTGEYQGLGFSVFSTMTSMARNYDGTLMFWSTASAARYSATGTLMGIYNAPAGQLIKEATLGPFGRTYLTTQKADGTNSQIHWYTTSTGALEGTQNWLNMSLTSDGTYAIATFESSHSEFWTATAGNGNPVSGFYSGATGLPATQFNSAAVGHIGMSYHGAYNGSWHVLRYDYGVNVSRGLFGSFDSVDGLDVVAAPEPGTMAVLSLGLLPLLKRRRR